VQGLLSAAVENPWGALDTILDGPLHPGGRTATAELLDSAAVGSDTRLLDVGCGAGTALEQARGRGASAVGLDTDPGGSGETIRGDLGRLPLAANSVDVVLAECVLCLADDLDAALADTVRVLDPEGRLALSDVVVEGPLPELPSVIERTLCLDGDRRPERLLGAIERAGLTVEERRDRSEDLLSMRDRVAASVDYERLLGSMGDRGQRLLDGIDELERAVEDGRIGYVSIVATA
jgi:arsenite methyltransferase